MKRSILSLTFAVGIFYAGVANAQNSQYCILNDVATHCPAIILPAVVPSIISDQQQPANYNYNVPYDMQAMSSGYNISTPVAPAATTINGIAYATNMNDIVARRKAYSGVTAVNTGGANSHVSNVYPNPVLATTRVTLNTLTVSPVQVDILDLNGVIIRTYAYAAGVYNLDVDMSGLPQGLYSVRVYGKEIPMENLKVMKQ